MNHIGIVDDIDEHIEKLCDALCNYVSIWFKNRLHLPVYKIFFKSNCTAGNKWH